MKRKYLPYLLVALIAFPQTTMAHFVTPHDPFWHEPMHFIVDHYIGLMLIVVGIVAIAVSSRKKPKKNNEKIK